MKSKHRGWTLVITLSLIDVLILFFSRPHAWSSFGNLFFVHLLSAWNIFYGDIMIKPFKKQLARIVCYTNHPGGYSRTVTEHIFIVTQIQGNLILKIVIFLCAMRKHAFIYTFITWVKEGVLNKRRCMTRLIEIIIHDSIQHLRSEHRP